MPIVAPREILKAAHSSGYAIGAFNAGFICDIISGWDVPKAARLGNACDAIVVTRHGCSISMPTMDEVVAFAKDEAFYNRK
jgi:hypothetical protein